MKDNSNAPVKRTLSVRFLILLTFNIVIIVSLFYAFEVYLRITDPRAKLPRNEIVEDPQNPEKKEYYTWGHLVELNSDDFRERELPKNKPSGVYRVMVLGDSFTFGNGLAINERYTNLLEVHLNNEFSGTGVRYEVWNFGIEGVPTVSEKNVLRFYKDRLAPDLIVVGFCLNDTQVKGQGYSVEKEAFDNNWRPLIMSVKTKLTYLGLRITGEVIEKAVYRLAERAWAIPTWQVALARTYEQASVEWKKFSLALKEIKAMSDSLKLPPPIFAILNQATYTDRPTDYRDPDFELERFLNWYALAENAARETGFRAYDHTVETAIELSKEPIAINVMDPHPSPALNKLYAEKLFNIIKTEYLNDKKN
ncbi:MAG: SGNH/GDSL hydrolase family protein [Thermodesulfobacteriota bacterium]